MAKNTKQAPSIMRCNTQKSGDLAKRLPTVGRMSLWKMLMGARLSDALKINLITLVCLAPVIYIVAQILVGALAVQSALPFTSFIGVGYPAVIAGSEIAFVETQKAIMLFTEWMLPVAVFISLFLLTSTAYATRDYVWTEGYFRFKSLIKAFKFNFVNAFILAIIGAGLAFGGAHAFLWIRELMFYGGVTFVNVLLVIVFAIVALVVLTVMMFAGSISLTYKGNIVNVMRDAFVLTFKFAVPNFIITLAVVAPLFLLSLIGSGFIQSMLITAFIFIGFAYMLVTFTVYSQFIFDRATGRG